jgi:hypothetical protein
VSDWDLGGVALLGVFHGLNPAMGWLLAAAVGFQAASRRALLLALVPIALGHEASVAVTVGLVEELRVVASDTLPRLTAASLLAVLAVLILLRRHRHGRWIGMRFGKVELGLWSFLVSSAHGAGLMLVPFVMGVRVHDHDHHALASGFASAGLAASLHTAAMALTAAAVAVLVYDVIGIALLRRAWVDLDRVWAVALLGGAALTLFLA